MSFSSRGKEKSGLLISYSFEDDEESRISAAELQTKDMKQLVQAQLQPEKSRLLFVDELIAKHVARKSLPGRYLFL